ncbi:hypothetical protein J6590_020251 [Homalodisca vitripennis]|nr:hypothetical protein J6590_020251 [Homalodisca vitripennis]
MPILREVVSIPRQLLRDLDITTNNGRAGGHLSPLDVIAVQERCLSYVKWYLFLDNYRGTWIVGVIPNYNYEYSFACDTAGQRFDYTVYHGRYTVVYGGVYVTHTRNGHRTVFIWKIYPEILCEISSAGEVSGRARAARRSIDETLSLARRLAETCPVLLPPPSPNRPWPNRFSLSAKWIFDRESG